MTRRQASGAGRPRSSSIDSAILAATRELLAEVGYSGLSIEAIARRAGTTRPAVYRRWDALALIVLEAVFGTTTTLEVPEVADVRGELSAAAGGFASELNDPVARAAVGGLLGDLAASQALRRRVEERVLEPEHAGLAAILSRAAERGEIADGVDADVVAAALAGALVYRTCICGIDADAEFVARVVDLVVKGATTP